MPIHVRPPWPLLLRIRLTAQVGCQRDAALLERWPAVDGLQGCHVPDIKRPQYCVPSSSFFAELTMSPVMPSAFVRPLAIPLMLAGACLLSVSSAECQQAPA